MKIYIYIYYIYTYIKKYYILKAQIEKQIKDLTHSAGLFFTACCYLTGNTLSIVYHFIW